MNLEEWKERMKNAVDRFASEYEEKAREDPRDFPSEMKEEDWFEQFGLWMSL